MLCAHRLIVLVLAANALLAADGAAHLERRRRR